MEISVRGKNNKLTKKEIRDIISFSSKILLGKRLSKYVSITVLNSKLKKYEWGYCGPTDWNNSKRREFEILLNNSASRKNQIITILHEMVHLKQYTRNELVQYHNDKYKWLGKKIRIETTQYETLPWEIEATKTEKVLFELYREHVRSQ
jgi:Zn-dependent peptidase ImmA (M78 family)